MFKLSSTQRSTVILSRTQEVKVENKLSSKIGVRTLVTTKREFNIQSKERLTVPSLSEEIVMNRKSATSIGDVDLSSNRRMKESKSALISTERISEKYTQKIQTGDRVNTEREITTAESFNSSHTRLRSSHESSRRVQGDLGDRNILIKRSNIIKVPQHKSTNTMSVPITTSNTNQRNNLKTQKNISEEETFYSVVLQSLKVQKASHVDLPYNDVKNICFKEKIEYKKANDRAMSLPKLRPNLPTFRKEFDEASKCYQGRSRSRERERVVLKNGYIGRDSMKRSKKEIEIDGKGETLCEEIIKSMRQSLCVDEKEDKKIKEKRDKRISVSKILIFLPGSTHEVNRIE